MSEEFHWQLSSWLGIWAAVLVTISALFVDVLLIRVFLVGAFLLFLVESIAGAPAWDEPYEWGVIQIDMFVMSLLNLYIHMAHIYFLVIDERHISYMGDDQEALWRYMYRRSGLTRLVFKKCVLPYLEVLEYESGEAIENYVCILFKGEVDAVRIDKKDGIPKPMRMTAGSVFDLRHLSYILLNHDFFKCQELEAKANGKCRVFAFKMEDIQLMSLPGNVHLRQLWVSIFNAGLANFAEREIMHSYDSQDVVMDWFRPLDPREEPTPWISGSSTCLFPSSFLSNTLKVISSGFHVPLPGLSRSLPDYGTRHHMVPPTLPSEVNAP